MIVRCTCIGAKNYTQAKYLEEIGNKKTKGNISFCVIVIIGREMSSIVIVLLDIKIKMSFFKFLTSLLLIFRLKFLNCLLGCCWLRINLVIVLYFLAIVFFKEQIYFLLEKRNQAFVHIRMHSKLRI